MEKNSRHIVRSWGFYRVNLLQSLENLISCEGLGELWVHVLCHASGDRANDFNYSSGLSGDVDFLKISHSSGYNISFAFTPLTNIILEPKDSVLFYFILFYFPSVRRPSMEEFGVFVSLSVLVHLAVLMPHSFFIVKKIIDFLLELIDLCPQVSFLISGSKNIEQFPFLLNFLWDVAHYSLIPIG